jgi:hypothetical protein
MAPVGSIPAKVNAEPQLTQFVEAVTYIDSVFEDRGLALTRSNYQPTLPTRKMYQSYERFNSLYCTIAIRPESGMIYLDMFSPRPFFEFDGTPQFQSEYHQIRTSIIDRFGSGKVDCK